LFASLPPEHAESWSIKYRAPYPNASDLRRIAVELDFFAAQDGAAFAEFAGRLLNVQAAEPAVVFYVCPWTGGSISEPGILNPTRSTRLMQITVLHELAHRLLTRNDAYDLDRSRRGSLSDAWRSQWGADLSFVTLTHVPVFALLEEYVRCHPDLRAQLEANRRRHSRHPAYASAWEVVDQRGSATVCGEAREAFQLLRRARAA
jgi:hypothetical protein